MKPALGYHWIDPVKQWQDMPLGEQLLELESELIASRLKLCFGRHLLKLGELAAEVDTSGSLINHQIVLKTESGQGQGSEILGEVDDLPLASHSIDAVVSAHLLEYCADPHQVLREAHRVLMPNGNLILSVFNPLSPLIFGRLWPFKNNKVFWRGRWFTIGRIKDWLNLLGFEVTHEDYCAYSMLLSKKQNLKENKLGKVNQKLSPKLGSVCVITAKKREWPLTPIRPRLRYKTIFSPAVRGAQATKNIS